MFFEKHVFCCINKRPDSNPKGCCSLKNSEKLHTELKLKIKDLKLNKKIRINKSGCLASIVTGKQIGRASCRERV